MIPCDYLPWWILLCRFVGLFTYENVCFSAYLSIYLPIYSFLYPQWISSFLSDHGQIGTHLAWNDPRTLITDFVEPEGGPVARIARTEVVGALCTCKKKGAVHLWMFSRSGQLFSLGTQVSANFAWGPALARVRLLVGHLAFSSFVWELGVFGPLGTGPFVWWNLAEKRLAEEIHPLAAFVSAFLSFFFPGRVAWHFHFSYKWNKKCYW